MLMAMMAFALSVLCLPSLAQTIKLPGKILDEKGDPVPGATIRFKDQRGGVITHDDGTFTITSPLKGTLIITALGFTDKQVDVDGLITLSVTLVKANKELDEVVVTAYGIRRAKNTLPYAAQTISGDEANKVRVTNISAGLSGKVSGLQIIQNNEIGGSVNVVIRGVKSLTGNNQALFVIDGVPFDNTTSTSNTSPNVPGPSTQNSGQGGYDFGNAAGDINPDDIESINVLKGAAASALYGSRAANGVIMITTKKGRSGTHITANAGMTVGRIDKTTFVRLQNEYGAGRSDYFPNPTGTNTGFIYVPNIFGSGNAGFTTNTTAPRSWGPAFNKNLLIYQWDAFDPSSPTYQKATPWVAGAHGPTYFYQTSISNNNSVFLDGANANGSYKLGYTRTNDRGDLPNSTLTRNQFTFASSYKIVDRLTISGAANYYADNALGRYSTGYDAQRNPNVVFRQYGETNVDYKEQKQAYFRHYQNITWNWTAPTTATGLTADFYNNPYWSAYQNYEDDNRGRFFGNVALNYQATDWLNLMARVAVDEYNMFEEERSAVGSEGGVAGSYYRRTNSSYSEINYDLLATGTHQLNPNLKLNELLGVNIRKDNLSSIYATTNQGLVIPLLYTIANSAVAPNPPYETQSTQIVDGYFAGATLTYKDFLSLDGTFRRDISSTLPVNNNAYNYYGISGSWVFFQHLKNMPWLSSGKLRANYATVGNSAPPQSTYDQYTVNTNLNTAAGSSYLYSLPTTKANNGLVPERTNSEEVGVEIAFLKNRLGLDGSYYHTNSINQIVPTQVSNATGYENKYVNAGNIRNQGVELSVFGTPIQTRNFSWDVNVNWTRNRNKVLSLKNGLNNLVLGSFQGSVTLNATVGKPYGVLQSGTYVFTNGQPTVTPVGAVAGTPGLYEISPNTNSPIGNVNPNWIGGITNTFRYKAFSLSFLIDMRVGGNVFSLDQYYAQMSGLLSATTGLNDLGNPKRDSVSQGGGVIYPGVTPDGKKNTIRATVFSSTSTVYPQSKYAYDASYIKLRETSLTYHLPEKVLGSAQNWLKGVDLSLIGRNLWLIHKNLPMADPEDNFSAGNVQGYQSGAYPTVRSLGLNLKLKF
jgi:TonB-linked SusC/RagA family outer membrane protein